MVLDHVLLDRNVALSMTHVLSGVSILGMSVRNLPSIGFGAFNSQMSGM